jgi:hypothetical protein
MKADRAHLVRWSLVAATLMLGAASPAFAGKKNFMAVLNGAQELPPTSSGAIGNGFFVFDTMTGDLCFMVGFTAGLLTSAETDCHIHGNLPDGNPPRDETGAPLNVIVSLPLGNPKEGCVNIPPQFHGILKKGLTYMNIHTMTNPGGEIRGQLTPVKGK